MAATVIALLAAGLAFACAAKTPTIAERILGSDLRLLPKESVGLAVVEMKLIRDREAAERWLEDLTSGIGNAPSLQTIRQAVGGEALRKVNRVALALVPQPGGTAGYAVLAEGDFEEPRMRALTGGQGILTLLEVAGHPDVSLTILPGGNPVFGPRHVLEEMNDTRASRSPGLGSSRLLGIMGRIGPTAQVWGAIDYAPLADLSRRALQAGGRDVPFPPVGSGNLRTLAFQGVIDTTVVFDLFGQADAEAGARQLADAARGLVALARMGAGQKEARPWLEFLDGIRIDQSGAEIQVHGTLSSAMAQALSGRIPWPGGEPPAGAVRPPS